MKSLTDWTNKFTGVLIGMAVGDAIGLPREGLTPRRARRLFGDAPLGHRFIFRGGMISDDTEHACMTAQSLLASGGEPEPFARSLAWRLRGWLLGMPAGVGFATLRSILRLWLGFSPNNSGVDSAGNGPAMRAPILGTWIAATGMPPDCRLKLIQASTRLTHTDQRAFEGALVIALATAQAATASTTVNPLDFVSELQPHVHGAELCRNLMNVCASLNRGMSTQEFAHTLGLSRGVTGYINHTVPIALYCYLRWPGDFRRAVEDAVLAGGDTDTTAAIVGGMAGAALGVSAIPQEWLSGLLEWPRSVTWMRSLGDRLAQKAAEPTEFTRPLPLFWPGLLCRNLFFATIVIFHGLRRLLPPY
jgi:ADP-ribosyl-[dinitrogen reductase] hydrolase